MNNVITKYTVYNPRLLPHFIYPRSGRLATSRAKQANQGLQSNCAVLLPIAPTKVPNLFQMMGVSVCEEIRDAGNNVLLLLRDVTEEAVGSFQDRPVYRPEWLTARMKDVYSLTEELPSIISKHPNLWEGVKTNIIEPNQETILYYLQLLGIVLFAQEQKCDYVYIGQPEAIHIEAVMRYIIREEEEAPVVIPLYTPQLHLSSVAEVTCQDSCKTIHKKLLESLDHYPRPFSVLKGELLAIAYAVLPSDECEWIDDVLSADWCGERLSELLEKLAQNIEVHLCRRFSE